MLWPHHARYFDYRAFAEARNNSSRIMAEALLATDVVVHRSNLIGA